jgi:hypothetical protein
MDITRKLVQPCRSSDRARGCTTRDLGFGSRHGPICLPLFVQTRLGAHTNPCRVCFPWGKRPGRETEPSPPSAENANPHVFMGRHCMQWNFMTEQEEIVIQGVIIQSHRKSHRCCLYLSFVWNVHYSCALFKHFRKLDIVTWTQSWYSCWYCVKQAWITDHATHTSPRPADSHLASREIPTLFMESECSLPF